MTKTHSQDQRISAAPRDLYLRPPASAEREAEQFYTVEQKLAGQIRARWWARQDEVELAAYVNRLDPQAQFVAQIVLIRELGANIAGRIDRLVSGGMGLRPRQASWAGELIHTFGPSAASVQIEYGATTRGAKAYTEDTIIRVPWHTNTRLDRDQKKTLAHEMAHALQQHRGSPAARRWLGAAKRRRLETEAGSASRAFLRGERFTVTGRAPVAAALYRGKSTDESVGVAGGAAIKMEIKKTIPADVVLPSSTSGRKYEVTGDWKRYARQYDIRFRWTCEEVKMDTTSTGATKMEWTGKKIPNSLSSDVVNLDKMTRAEEERGVKAMFKFASSGHYQISCQPFFNGAEYGPPITLVQEVATAQAAGEQAIIQAKESGKGTGQDFRQFRLELGKKRQEAVGGSNVYKSASTVLGFPVWVERYGKQKLKATPGELVWLKLKGLQDQFLNRALSEEFTTSWTVTRQDGGAFVKSSAVDVLTQSRADSFLQHTTADDWRAGRQKVCPVKFAQIGRYKVEVGVLVNRKGAYPYGLVDTPGKTLEFTIEVRSPQETQNGVMLMQGQNPAEVSGQRVLKAEIRGRGNAAYVEGEHEAAATGRANLYKIADPALGMKVISWYLIPAELSWELKQLKSHDFLNPQTKNYQWRQISGDNAKYVDIPLAGARGGDGQVAGKIGHRFGFHLGDGTHAWAPVGDPALLEQGKKQNQLYVVAIQKDAAGELLCTHVFKQRVVTADVGEQESFAEKKKQEKNERTVAYAKRVDDLVALLPKNALPTAIPAAYVNLEEMKLVPLAIYGARGIDGKYHLFDFTDNEKIEDRDYVGADLTQAIQTFRNKCHNGYPTGLIVMDPPDLKSAATTNATTAANEVASKSNWQELIPTKGETSFRKWLGMGQVLSTTLAISSMVIGGIATATGVAAPIGVVLIGVGASIAGGMMAAADLYDQVHKEEIDVGETAISTLGLAAAICGFGNSVRALRNVVQLKRAMAVGEQLAARSATRAAKAAESAAKSGKPVVMRPVRQSEDYLIRQAREAARTKPGRIHEGIERLCHIIESGAEAIDFADTGMGTLILSKQLAIEIQMVMEDPSKSWSERADDLLAVFNRQVVQAGMGFIGQHSSLKGMADRLGHEGHKPTWISTTANKVGQKIAGDAPTQLGRINATPVERQRQVRRNVAKANKISPQIKPTTQPAAPAPAQPTTPQHRPQRGGDGQNAEPWNRKPIGVEPVVGVRRPAAVAALPGAVSAIPEGIGQHKIRNSGNNDFRDIFGNLGADGAEPEFAGVGAGKGGPGGIGPGNRGPGGGDDSTGGMRGFGEEPHRQPTEDPDINPFKDWELEEIPDPHFGSLAEINAAIHDGRLSPGDVFTYEGQHDKLKLVVGLDGSRVYMPAHTARPKGVLHFTSQFELKEAIEWGLVPIGQQIMLTDPVTEVTRHVRLVEERGHLRLEATPSTQSDPDPSSPRSGNASSSYDPRTRTAEFADYTNQPEIADQTSPPIVLEGNGRKVAVPHSSPAWMQQLQMGHIEDGSIVAFRDTDGITYLRVHRLADRFRFDLVSEADVRRHFHLDGSRAIGNEAPRAAEPPVRAPDMVVNGDSLRGEGKFAFDQSEPSHLVVNQIQVEIPHVDEAWCYRFKHGYTTEGHLVAYTDEHGVTTIYRVFRDPQNPRDAHFYKISVEEAYGVAMSNGNIFRFGDQRYQIRKDGLAHPIEKTDAPPLPLVWKGGDHFEPQPEAWQGFLKWWDNDYYQAALFINGERTPPVTALWNHPEQFQVGEWFAYPGPDGSVFGIAIYDGIDGNGQILIRRCSFEDVKDAYAAQGQRLETGYGPWNEGPRIVIDHGDPQGSEGRGGPGRPGRAGTPTLLPATAQPGAHGRALVTNPAKPGESPDARTQNCVNACIAFIRMRQLGMDGIEAMPLSGTRPTYDKIAGYLHGIDANGKLGGQWRKFSSAAAAANVAGTDVNGKPRPVGSMSMIGYSRVENGQTFQHVVMAVVEVDGVHIIDPQQPGNPRVMFPVDATDFKVLEVPGEFHRPWGGLESSEVRERWQRKQLRDRGQAPEQIAALRRRVGSSSMNAETFVHALDRYPNGRAPYEPPQMVMGPGPDGRLVLGVLNAGQDGALEFTPFNEAQSRWVADTNKLSFEELRDGGHLATPPAIDIKHFGGVVEMSVTSLTERFARVPGDDIKRLEKFDYEVSVAGQEKRRDGLAGRLGATEKYFHTDGRQNSLIYTIKFRQEIPGPDGTRGHYRQSVSAYVVTLRAEQNSSTEGPRWVLEVIEQEYANTFDPPDHFEAPDGTAVPTYQYFAIQALHEFGVAPEQVNFALYSPSQEQRNKHGTKHLAEYHDRSKQERPGSAPKQAGEGEEKKVKGHGLYTQEDFQRVRKVLLAEPGRYTIEELAVAANVPELLIKRYLKVDASGTTALVTTEINGRRVFSINPENKIALAARLGGKAGFVERANSPEDTPYIWFQGPKDNKACRELAKANPPELIAQSLTPYSDRIIYRSVNVEDPNPFPPTLEGGTLRALWYMGAINGGIVRQEQIDAAKSSVQWVNRFTKVFKKLPAAQGPGWRLEKPVWQRVEGAQTGPGAMATSPSRAFLPIRNHGAVEPTLGATANFDPGRNCPQAALLAAQVLQNGGGEVTPYLTVPGVGGGGRLSGQLSYTDVAEMVGGTWQRTNSPGDAATQLIREGIGAQGLLAYEVRQVDGSYRSHLANAVVLRAPDGQLCVYWLDAQTGHAVEFTDASAFAILPLGTDHRLSLGRAQEIAADIQTNPVQEPLRSSRKFDADARPEGVTPEKARELYEEVLSKLLDHGLDDESLVILYDLDPKAAIRFCTTHGERPAIHEANPWAFVQLLRKDFMLEVRIGPDGQPEARPKLPAHVDEASLGDRFRYPWPSDIDPPKPAAPTVPGRNNRADWPQTNAGLKPADKHPHIEAGYDQTAACVNVNCMAIERLTGKVVDPIGVPKAKGPTTSLGDLAAQYGGQFEELKGTSSGPGGAVHQFLGTQADGQTALVCGHFWDPDAEVDGKKVGRWESHLFAAVTFTRNGKKYVRYIDETSTGNGVLGQNRQWSPDFAVMVLPGKKTSPETIEKLASDRLAYRATREKIDWNEASIPTHWQRLYQQTKNFDESGVQNGDRVLLVHNDTGYAAIGWIGEDKTNRFGFTEVQGRDIATVNLSKLEWSVVRLPSDDKFSRLPVDVVTNLDSQIALQTPELMTLIGRRSQDASAIYQRLSMERRNRQAPTGGQWAQMGVDYGIEGFARGLPDYDRAQILWNIELTESAGEYPVRKFVEKAATGTLLHAGLGYQKMHDADHTRGIHEFTPELKDSYQRRCQFAAATFHSLVRFIDERPRLRKGQPRDTFNTALDYTLYENYDSPMNLALVYDSHTNTDAIDFWDISAFVGPHPDDFKKDVVDHLHDVETLQSLTPDDWRALEAEISKIHRAIYGHYQHPSARVIFEQVKERRERQRPSAPAPKLDTTTRPGVNAQANWLPNESRNVTADFKELNGKSNIWLRDKLAGEGYGWQIRSSVLRPENSTSITVRFSITTPQKRTGFIHGVFEHRGNGDWVLRIATDEGSDLPAKISGPTGFADTFTLFAVLANQEAVGAGFKIPIEKLQVVAMPGRPFHEHGYIDTAKKFQNGVAHLDAQELSALAQRLHLQPDDLRIRQNQFFNKTEIFLGERKRTGGYRGVPNYDSRPSAVARHLQGERAAARVKIHLTERASEPRRCTYVCTFEGKPDGILRVVREGLPDVIPIVQLRDGISVPTDHYIALQAMQLMGLKADEVQHVLTYPSEDVKNDWTSRLMFANKSAIAMSLEAHRIKPPEARPIRWLEQGSMQIGKFPVERANPARRDQFTEREVIIIPDGKGGDRLGMVTGTGAAWGYESLTLDQINQFAGLAGVDPATLQHLFAPEPITSTGRAHSVSQNGPAEGDTPKKAANRSGRRAPGAILPAGFNPPAERGPDGRLRRPGLRPSLKPVEYRDGIHSPTENCANTALIFAQQRWLAAGSDNPGALQVQPLGGSATMTVAELQAGTGARFSDFVPGTPAQAHATIVSQLTATARERGQRAVRRAVAAKQDPVRASQVAQNRTIAIVRVEFWETCTAETAAQARPGTARQHDGRWEVRASHLVNYVVEAGPSGTTRVVAIDPQSGKIINPRDYENFSVLVIPEDFQRHLNAPLEHTPEHYFRNFPDNAVEQAANGQIPPRRPKYANHDEDGSQRVDGPDLDDRPTGGRKTSGGTPGRIARVRLRQMERLSQRIPGVLHGIVRRQTERTIRAELPTRNGMDRLPDTQRLRAITEVDARLSVLLAEQKRLRDNHPTQLGRQQNIALARLQLQVLRREPIPMNTWDQIHDQLNGQANREQLPVGYHDNWGVLVYVDELARMQTMRIDQEQGRLESVQKALAIRNAQRNDLKRRLRRHPGDLGALLREDVVVEERNRLARSQTARRDAIDQTTNVRMGNTLNQRLDNLRRAANWEDIRSQSVPLGQAGEAGIVAGDQVVVIHRGTELPIFGILGSTSADTTEVNIETAYGLAGHDLSHERWTIAKRTSDLTANSVPPEIWTTPSARTVFDDRQLLRALCSQRNIPEAVRAMLAEGRNQIHINSPAGQILSARGATFGRDGWLRDVPSFEHDQQFFLNHGTKFRPLPYRDGSFYRSREWIDLAARGGLLKASSGAGRIHEVVSHPGDLFFIQSMAIADAVQLQAQTERALLAQLIPILSRHMSPGQAERLILAQGNIAENYDNATGFEPTSLTMTVEQLAPRVELLLGPNSSQYLERIAGLAEVEVSVGRADWEVAVAQCKQATDEILQRVFVPKHKSADVLEVTQQVRNAYLKFIVADKSRRSSKSDPPTKPPAGPDSQGRKAANGRPTAAGASKPISPEVAQAVEIRHETGNLAHRLKEWNQLSRDVELLQATLEVAVGKGEEDIRAKLETHRARLAELDRQLHGVDAPQLAIGHLQTVEALYRAGKISEQTAFGALRGIERLLEGHDARRTFGQNAFVEESRLLQRCRALKHEVAYRFRVRNHQTAIEVESYRVREFFAFVTTRDGTVGPVLEEGQGIIPTFLQEMAQAQGVPVHIIAWQALTVDQQMQLVEAQGAIQTSAPGGTTATDAEQSAAHDRFYACRELPGLTLREDAPPGLFGDPQYMGIASLLNFDGIEYHTRGSGQASRLRQYTRNLENEHNIGAVSRQQHVPFRFSPALRKGSSNERDRFLFEYSVFNATLDLVTAAQGQQARQFGSVFGATEGQPNLSVEHDHLSQADLDTSRAWLRGEQVEPPKTAQLGLRRGNVVDSMPGVNRPFSLNVDTAYKQRGRYGTFETRGPLNVAGMEHFSDALQWRALTGDAGPATQAFNRWYQHHLVAGFAPRLTYFNRPFTEQQVPKSIRFTAGFQTLKERGLIELWGGEHYGKVKPEGSEVHENYNYRMLFYDWGQNPLLYFDSPGQERVLRAQIHAIDRLAAQNGKPEEIIAQFVRESGLLELHARSMGLDNPLFENVAAPFQPIPRNQAITNQTRIIKVDGIARRAQLIEREGYGDQVWMVVVKGERRFYSLDGSTDITDTIGGGGRATRNLPVRSDDRGEPPVQTPYQKARIMLFGPHGFADADAALEARLIQVKRTERRGRLASDLVVRERIGYWAAYGRVCAEALGSTSQLTVEQSDYVRISNQLWDAVCDPDTHPPDEVHALFAQFYAFHLNGKPEFLGATAAPSNGQGTRPARTAKPRRAAPRDNFVGPIKPPDCGSWVVTLDAIVAQGGMARISPNDVRVRPSGTNNPPWSIGQFENYFHTRRVDVATEREVIQTMQAFRSEIDQTRNSRNDFDRSRMARAIVVGLRLPESDAQQQPGHAFHVRVDSHRNFQASDPLQRKTGFPEEKFASYAIIRTDKPDPEVLKQYGDKPPLHGNPMDVRHQTNGPDVVALGDSNQNGGKVLSFGANMKGAARAQNAISAKFWDTMDRIKAKSGYQPEALARLAAERVIQSHGVERKNDSTFTEAEAVERAFLFKRMLHNDADWRQITPEAADALETFSGSLAADFPLALSLVQNQKWVAIANGRNRPALVPETSVCQENGNVISLERFLVEVINENSGELGYQSQLIWDERKNQFDVQRGGANSNWYYLASNGSGFWVPTVGSDKQFVARTQVLSDARRISVSTGDRRNLRIELREQTRMNVSQSNGVRQNLNVLTFEGLVQLLEKTPQLNARITFEAGQYSVELTQTRLEWT